jgi:hypothetical protein
MAPAALMHTASRLTSLSAMHSLPPAAGTSWMDMVSKQQVAHAYGGCCRMMHRVCGAHGKPMHVVLAAWQKLCISAVCTEERSNSVV